MTTDDATRHEIKLSGGPSHGQVHIVHAGWPVPDKFALPSDDKRWKHWYETIDAEHAYFTGTTPND